MVKYLTRHGICKLITIPCNNIFYLPANAAPIISAVSGLDRLDGEYILYLEVNKEVTFTVNGTDDGLFSYRLDSSIPNITITETEGNADITVNLLNTDPQSLG